MDKVVPETLLMEPFYAQGDRVLITYNESLSERQWSISFAEDMVDDVRPWLKPYEHVSLICEKWNKEKAALSLLYKNRQMKEAKAGLRKAKALLIQSVCWLNHERVSLLTFNQHLKRFRNKPINGVERIQFILTHDHYLSFIQLCAIMDELQRLNERIYLLSSQL
ncbi:hypothetical protein JCM19046_4556 [Bacillus sp. JCM 19046]|nr:hypothetical protein JCM19045_3710 [Bacillus sp. JCM 19045]GAF19872.1 hypothetical protein JCM19046_4556 [Bacillus sp. JCM 19046]